MDYKYIEQRGEDIVLTEIKHFVPSQVLDCGQSFRWSGDGENYSGIAFGRRLELALESNDLILKNVSFDEFESIWKNYFDLGRNYGKLRQRYSVDDTLEKAMAFSPGLRLMRQDIWETLVTFILSQNSNIPRIKGMVARLCENFGSVLPCGGYTFPAPKVLAGLSADDLSALRSGYRADYIIDAAKRASDGRLNFSELQCMPSEDVRKSLMEVHGVGPKVADCVLLYGFGRVERYPLDVWMKRAMADYYPNGFPEALTDTAGIAQQFLFHYIRTSR